MVHSGGKAVGTKRRRGDVRSSRTVIAFEVTTTTTSIGSTATETLGRACCSGLRQPAIDDVIFIIIIFFVIIKIKACGQGRISPNFLMARGVGV